MPAESIRGILTRHFLRRFLENDLLSPEADRTQLLAVVGAGLVTTTLFLSAFMSFSYVGVYQTPAQVALLALSDRFFYIALSMVVVGLVAVSQWDALALDARDIAILEPLPLAPGVIRRAKLTAVALLGGAAALAVSVVPSVIFPWLMVFHQRVGLAAVAALIVTHALVTIVAGASTYLAVVVLREALAAMLRPRLFARVSPWVQGGLILFFGSALLLLPAMTSEIGGRNGFSDGQRHTPPVWFLGAYELAVGDLIATAPVRRLTPRQQRAHAAATAIYARHRQDARMLAQRATTAVVAIVVAAAALCFTTTRRLPPLAVPANGHRRRQWFGATLPRLVALDSTTRAGYFFTLAAVWRSSVHRLTVACALAAGLAASIVALSGVDVAAAAASGTAPTRLLMVQPLVVGALLLALRHAIRIPAELRANWGFQLAWRDADRQFVAGVTRAGLLGVILPALGMMLPLFGYVLGWPLALLHAGIGLAAAAVLLEALLVRYDKVPFTCTYLPNENMKALGPIYVIAFLLAASLAARIAGAALRDPALAVRLLVMLAITYAILRLASYRRPRLLPVDFNEAPATTQRLGLHT